MTGHRKWSEIRNPVMDEPVHRHLREELRRANDIALELGRLRARRAAKADQSSPTTTGDALVILESEYLAALRQSIEDLGGRLEITATFPDQRITLTPKSCTIDEASD